MNNNKQQQGYMTVGELAKKMGITVRALQFYDRQGLFSPSAQSEGGRRLYTDKDAIRLYQILALKNLGFSLSDIKNRIITLETPAQVSAALTRQAGEIKSKIEILTDSLNAIELLNEEVLQMQSVDFKRYSDILENLQMKNEHYWIIKYFDENTLDYLRQHFDKDSGSKFMNTFHDVYNKIHRLTMEKLPPDCEQAQAAAKEFWELIMEFTGGDIGLITNLMKLESIAGAQKGQRQSMAIANEYIGQALDVYFTALGVDPTAKPG